MKLTEDDIFPHYSNTQYADFTTVLNNDRDVGERFSNWCNVHEYQLDAIFINQATAGTGMGIELGLKKWKKIMFVNYEFNQIKQKTIDAEINDMVTI